MIVSIIRATVNADQRPVAMRGAIAILRCMRRTRLITSFTNSWSTAKRGAAPPKNKSAPEPPLVRETGLKAGCTKCGLKKQVVQNPLPLVRKKGLKALYGVPSDRSSGACTTVVQKTTSAPEPPPKWAKKQKCVRAALSSILGRLGVCARSAPEPPLVRETGLKAGCTSVVQKWTKKQQVCQNPHCLYYCSVRHHVKHVLMVQPLNTLDLSLWINV